MCYNRKACLWAYRSKLTFAFQMKAFLCWFMLAVLLLLLYCTCRARNNDFFFPMIFFFWALKVPEKEQSRENGILALSLLACVLLLPQAGILSL